RSATSWTRPTGSERRRRSRRGYRRQMERRTLRHPDRAREFPADVHQRRSLEEGWARPGQAGQDAGRLAGGDEKATAHRTGHLLARGAALGEAGPGHARDRQVHVDLERALLAPRGRELADDKVVPLGPVSLPNM